MSSLDVGAPVSNAAFIFAALGDRTRLSLLMRLSDGQARSIVALAAETQLTRQAVTKHLRTLETAGLVGSIRVGRENRFAYRPAAIIEAKSYLDLISTQWDDALLRLRLRVEE
jgi:DNA-binding transcriptional ArsR family regulator